MRPHIIFSNTLKIAHINTQYKSIKKPTLKKPIQQMINLIFK